MPSSCTLNDTSHRNHLGMLFQEKDDKRGFSLRLTGNICSVAAMLRSLRNDCVIFRAELRDLKSSLVTAVYLRRSWRTRAFFCTRATGLWSNSVKGLSYADIIVVFIAEFSVGISRCLHFCLHFQHIQPKIRNIAWCHFQLKSPFYELIDRQLETKVQVDTKREQREMWVI